MDIREILNIILMIVGIMSFLAGGTLYFVATRLRNTENPPMSRYLWLSIFTAKHENFVNSWGLLSFRFSGILMALGGACGAIKYTWL